MKEYIIKRSVWKLKDNDMRTRSEELRRQ